MKPAVIFAMMLVFLFPLFAWAVEWESIARQADEEILVDLDSYAEHGAYSSIMTKVISHPPKSAMVKQQTVTQQKVKQERVTQQMELEFDCSQQRYRQHQPAAKQTAREFKPVSQDAQANTVSGLVCQVRRMLNPQS